MLSVENISFRATTFYGIESNTHLVIPNHKLTNSIIANYTQPTLDYRKKITIYIPDQKHIKKNIPRLAEKILLLAAFITTGVKKPRLPDQCDFDPLENKDQIRDVTKLENLEDENKILIDTNWKKILNHSQEDRKKLFLYSITELISKDTNQDKQEIKIIKKIVSSILSVLKEYKENRNISYHIDDFLVKRKSDAFNAYNMYNKDELTKMAEHLVSINYYYFVLTKQLWSLKLNDNSKQQQNDFDRASLEVLDVPRVTSKHRRDLEGAFWEVTLLVTVELGEQSDEIMQHINMFIDTLWDIFDLPSRCNTKD